ncbi:Glutaredoxin [Melia azedarach]|uniref:Glutaredoxin n=1 Tax=Melia azedarach TaxID=155640 RepID=A0ACC1X517_MELAZ|nr:Glutaredoxin [Melia azedarach]
MALNKAKEIVVSFPVVVFRYIYIYIYNLLQLCLLLLRQILNSFISIFIVPTTCSKTSCGDGDQIQSALAGWTGQRTVPNVFIGKKHVGGCDTLLEKHQEGNLVPLLTDAGAIIIESAQL